MHFLMMSLYAAITAIVSAGIAPQAETPRQRVIYGLKVFGTYLGVGILLSWLLYPLPRL
jgi:hypothetical protein